MRWRQSILGGCSTWWMPYWVYAALSVDSWSWNAKLVKDILTLYPVLMIELWTRKRDEGRRWEWYGGYEGIWQIWPISFLIGFKIPWISVLTWRIGRCTCHIGNGKLTCTQNSLKSQFLMLISPISSDLSVSSPQLSHHLRIQNWVIPLYLPMPQSLVDTKYSINPRLTVSHWQPVSHHLSFLRPCVYYTLNILTIMIYPMNRVSAPFVPPNWLPSDQLPPVQLPPDQLPPNQLPPDQLPSDQLPPDQPPPHWLPPDGQHQSTPPNSLNHSLQVHIQTNSIMSSKFAQQWPQSASPNFLGHSFQVQL